MTNATANSSTIDSKPKKASRANGDGPRWKKAGGSTKETLLKSN
jgi:hypothetical protein